MEAVEIYKNLNIPDNHLKSFIIYLLEKFSLHPSLELGFTLSESIRYWYEDLDKDEDEIKISEEYVQSLKSILGETTKLDDQHFQDSGVDVEEELEKDLTKFVGNHPDRSTKRRKTETQICDCRLCYLVDFIIDMIYNPESVKIPVPQKFCQFQKVKIFKEEDMDELNEFLTYAMDGVVEAALVFDYPKDKDQYFCSSRVKLVKSYTNVLLDFKWKGDYYKEYSFQDAKEQMDLGYIIQFIRFGPENISFRKVDDVYIMIYNFSERTGNCFLERYTLM